MVCVIAQVGAPVLAARVGTRFPEVAYLVVPYAAAAILFIACVELALVSVWRLRSPVDGGVGRSGAIRWVDVLVASAVIATALATVVLLHMIAVVPGGGGPMVYYLAGSIAGGVVVARVALVSRHRLVSGVGDRKEIESAR